MGVQGRERSKLSSSPIRLGQAYWGRGTAHGAIRGKIITINDTRISITTTTTVSAVWAALSARARSSAMSPPAGVEGGFGSSFTTAFLGTSRSWPSSATTDFAAGRPDGGPTCGSRSNSRGQRHTLQREPTSRAAGRPPGYGAEVRPSGWPGPRPAANSPRPTRPTPAGRWPRGNHAGAGRQRPRGGARRRLFERRRSGAGGGRFSAKSAVDARQSGASS